MLRTEIKPVRCCKSYFTAVNTKNISFLAEDCSAALRNSVQGIIYDLNVRGAAQYYNNSFIHDIQIARYIRDGKTATIVFEISVEYYSYIVGRHGSILSGDETQKVQTVYEAELVYLQDVERKTKDGEDLKNNCPNCGAPIKNLRAKFCNFCGTAFVERDIRTWKFDSVAEQPLQRRQYTF